MAGHGFDIVSRSQWGARQPRARTRQDPRNVRELFIHWPGASGSLASINTPAEERQWMRDTQRFHMDTRGWSDFAYSYAVFLSGRIYAGRTFRYVPAGQEGHNSNTVAVVCVLGSTDDITGKMRETLREVVKWAEKYGGHRRELRVRAHRDVNQTSCPGPALAAFVPSLDRI